MFFIIITSFWGSSVNILISESSHGCLTSNRSKTIIFCFLSSYGAVLENLQSRADLTERIRGCIVDSAPVLEIRPEVRVPVCFFLLDQVYNYNRVLTC